MTVQLMWGGSAVVEGLGAGLRYSSIEVGGGRNRVAVFVRLQVRDMGRGTTWPRSLPRFPLHAVPQLPLYAGSPSGIMEEYGAEVPWLHLSLVHYKKVLDFYNWAGKIRSSFKYKFNHGKTVAISHKKQ